VKWRPAETGEPGGPIKIPTNWLYLHYYDALTVLFRVENALRVFVYVILKNAHEEKWSELTIPGEGDKVSIGGLAKQRIIQSRVVGYLSYVTTSPMMYLGTGELIRIMVADPYWKHFKSYFPAGREILKAKLEEIEAIRNALAHFRPIQPDDVEVVKQNAKQMFSRIESALADMVLSPDTVPTNTTEDWYSDLKTLGTAHCSIRFTQSPDTDWVSVILKSENPLLWQHKSPSHHWCKTLAVDAAAIIRSHRILTQRLTFVTEDIGLLTYARETPPSVSSKELKFVFRRDKLATHRSEIKAQLESVLSKITDETELITRDNLARGDIVRLVSFAFDIPEEGKHGYEVPSALASAVSEDDPAEWWGSDVWFGRDIVSDIRRFPWMPTDISRFSFF
jgi:Swt1-like HEPN